MKEIVNRLHENRQIQLAKEILESNGYKVEKKLDEAEADLSELISAMEEADFTLAQYAEENIDFAEFLPEIHDIISGMLRSTPEGIYSITMEELPTELDYYLSRLPSKKTEEYDGDVSGVYKLITLPGKGDVVYGAEDGQSFVAFTKDILESNEYKVSKKVNEADDLPEEVDAQYLVDTIPMYTDLGIYNVKDYIVPLYNQGLKLLSSGRSVDQIINSSVSQLQSLFDETKEALQARRRKKFDSPESQRYNKAYAACIKFYEENILSVLIATDQVKVYREASAGRLKIKPKDSKYFMSTLLSADKSEIQKYLGSSWATF